MATGDDIVALARELISRHLDYDPKCTVNLDDKNPRGFDCSGFVLWIVGQFRDQGASVGPNHKASDQYTYCTVNDPRNERFTVQRAFDTPGAILYRAHAAATETSPEVHEHIAISAGDNVSTLEAMDSAHDVVEWKQNNKTRGWTGAALIPGVHYPTIDPPPVGPPSPGCLLNTYAPDSAGIRGPTTVPCRVRGEGTAAPADATAVMLNITAVKAAPRFISASPSDFPPDVRSSNINIDRSRPTLAGLVTVGIGADDRVRLHTHDRADLIVEPLRWFTADDGLVPLDPPVRLLDTRSGNLRVGYPADAGRPGLWGVVTVAINGNELIPTVTDAEAVVLTVTCVNAPENGFVTVWPTGTPRPGTSNLNVTQAALISNQVIVRVGESGHVTLFTQNGTDLVVDITGYLEPRSTLKAIPPVRILETRSKDTVGWFDGALKAGGQATFPVAGAQGLPETVKEVVLNVTATENEGPGHVCIWPTGTPRTSSILSLCWPGQTLPNLTIVPVGPDGTVTVSSSCATHLVADVFGYILG